MSDTLYTDAEREIYRFRDGGRDVCVDPAVVWRRFRQAQRELNVDYGELMRTYRAVREAEEAEERAASEAGREPEPIDPLLASEAEESLRLVAELGRRAFGREPLGDDGSGWTESQGQLALLEFLRWQAELRGKAASPPPGSPSTGGPPGDSASGESPGSPTGSTTPSN